MHVAGHPALSLSLSTATKGDMDVESRGGGDTPPGGCCRQRMGYDLQDMARVSAILPRL